MGENIATRTTVYATSVETQQYVTSADQIKAMLV